MSAIDAVTLIKEFEGIIGALLGVVVTMVLTKFFQNAGKVTSYIDDVEFSFYERDEIGGMNSINDAEEAEYGGLTFSLQMHNSSETLKAIRNFKIVFVDENKKFLFFTVPKDESTRKVVGGRIQREDLSILNVSPKQIVQYEVFSFLSEQQCKSVKDCGYVYFEYDDTNNKRRRNLIYTF